MFTVFFTILPYFVIEKSASIPRTPTVFDATAITPMISISLHFANSLITCSPLPSPILPLSSAITIMGSHLACLISSTTFLPGKCEGFPADFDMHLAPIFDAAISIAFLATRSPSVTIMTLLFCIYCSSINNSYLLDLGLNKIDIIYPNTMAPAIPPAVPVMPPVNAPIIPFSLTPSIAPLAKA